MNSPTLNKGVYIQPKINLKPNLHSFLESRGGDSLESLTKLLDSEKSKTLVVAEPGFGKSRLLKELIKLAGNDYECGFFDLKKSDSDILGYIQKCLASKSKIMICLDALDEVRHDLFYKTVERIEEIESLIKDHSNIKLFVSCRTHHVVREKARLSKLGFSIAEIQSFSFQDAVEYLKKVCPSREEGELRAKLSEKNKFGYWNRNNILSVPRYLEIFAEFIESEGLDKVLEYGRYELFEKFIFEKLRKEEVESKKNGFGYSRKIFYVKQSLERLALILEIQRTNEISKDDFVTFMLDTNLNLDSQLLLEIFYDRTILKDNGDSVEFENTEFQEYLAAKAISRFSRSEQIIFDVAVEQKLDDIYENWLDVLSYLVEIEPNLLLPIIRYAAQIKIPNHFVLLKYPNHTHVDKLEKSEIFDIILNFYTQEVRYIIHDENWGEILGEYFVKDDNRRLLLDAIKGQNEDYSDRILRANVAFILRGLFYRYQQDKGIFSEKEIIDWKNKLQEYAHVPFNYGDKMQFFSIYALAKIYQSIEELDSIKSLYGQNDAIDDAIITAYAEVNANHTDSIELFFRKMRRDSPYSEGFSSIDTQEGFVNFFKVMENNGGRSVTDWQDTYTYKVISGMDNMTDFYLNLENNWNNEIGEYAIELTVYAIHKWHYFNLIENLLEILNKGSGGALPQILDRLHSSDEKIFLRFLSNYKHTDSILKEHQAMKFIDTVESKFGEKVNAFIPLYCSSNPDVKALAKIHFSEQFEKSILANKSYIQNNQEIDDERYNKFIENLNKGHHDAVKLYIYPGNPYFFDNHKEFNDSVKQEFKQLIEKILKYNPVHSEEGYKSSDSYKWAYGYSIELIEKFEINIESYRQEILYFLPYKQTGVNGREINDIIFAIIPNPTEEEVNELLLMLRKHNIASHLLIEISDRYNTEATDNILRSIVENKSSIIDEIIHANEALVRKGDEEALEWLVKEILKNIRKRLSNYARKDTTPSYKSDIKDIYMNMKEVRNIEFRFKSLMLGLLKESCKLINNNKFDSGYFRSVVCEPVSQYFINLKSRKYHIKENLQDINKTLSDFVGTKAYISFQPYLDKIRNHYIKELSQPDKISDAIKKYNELKAKKYIDITTPMELYDVVKKVIDRDLKHWIEQEGANKVIMKFTSTTRERAIQDYIIPKLKYCFMREGLRDSDMTLRIYKEAQNTGDERIDLLITYGLVGAILLELKREKTFKLSAKNKIEYANKIKYNYMQPLYADYCILLIFGDVSNRKTKTFKEYLTEHKAVYKDEPNIEVLGIDCIGNQHQKS